MVCQFHTAYTRHEDVGYEQLNCRLVILVQLESFGGAGGSDNAVAGVLQGASDERANGAFIIHYQDSTEIGPEVHGGGLFKYRVISHVLLQFRLFREASDFPESTLSSAALRDRLAS